MSVTIRIDGIRENEDIMIEIVRLHDYFKKKLKVYASSIRGNSHSKFILTMIVCFRA